MQYSTGLLLCCSFVCSLCMCVLLQVSHIKVVDSWYWDTGLHFHEVVWSLVRLINTVHFQCVRNLSFSAVAFCLGILSCLSHEHCVIVPTYLQLSLFVCGRCYLSFQPLFHMEVYSQLLVCMLDSLSDNSTHAPFVSISTKTLYHQGFIVAYLQTAPTTVIHVYLKGFGPTGFHIVLKHKISFPVLITCMFEKRISHSCWNACRSLIY